MINIYGSEALKKFISENNVKEIPNYAKENITQKLKSFAGLSPVCELILNYQFEEYNGEYSYYNFNIIIKYKNYPLIPSKKERHSSTYTFSFAEKTTKKLSYFDLSKYNLEAPPCISKATVKKMDAWIEYLLKLKDAQQDYILKSNDKSRKFKDQLIPFQKQLTWLNENEGYITKSGIQYFFKIRENGSVHQTIKLDENIPNKLECFSALSNNSYQQQKNIFLLYTCDAWHSISSKELVAPFSDQYQLDLYLKGLKAGKLRQNDIDSLQSMGQTQGHEINYMVEEYPVNPANEESTKN